MFHACVQRGDKKFWELKGPKPGEKFFAFRPETCPVHVPIVENFFLSFFFNAA